MKLRIWRYRDRSAKERLVYFICETAGLLDWLIFVLSLTLLASDFRAYILFSDWAMDWTEG